MHSADVCYICGYHGVTRIAQTRPGNHSTGSKVPCFPSLLLVPPAPSSKPPSASDGHVRLCLLCWRLLVEQWNSYEKRKTPLSNRQYWFKGCFVNRDTFDPGCTPRGSADRPSATEGDALDQSHSVSPNAGSDDARDAGFHGLASSKSSFESRLNAAVSSSVKSKTTVAESKSMDVDMLTCVVCCGEIDSMDVCRRLPAHLVANVTDLKPNASQATERILTGNLTGEALVCDECFASPSFQSAWLECCRRGGAMHSTSYQPQQTTASKNKRHEQIGASADISAGQTRQASEPCASNQLTFTDAQRQWFALYERALLQFHITGHLDPLVVGQLQQLAAAETLASLQHSGGGEETGNK